MKTKLFAAVLILVVFVFDISSFAHAASDDTYVFAPIADVTIRQDAPDRNYGFITTLQTDNSPIKNFLLKFDVTGVDNRPVLKATLRLYNEDPSSMGGDFHFMPDSTWDEGTVTWNNAPDQDPFIYASLGSVAAGNWYEVDLTSLIAADGVYSLRVTSTASNGADYASREGSNSPQLVLIVSNDTSPAPTITPTYTSTPSQTPSNTPIATHTLTDTPTSTQTASSTPSMTPTFTSTPTQIPSSTPSTTSTFTPISSSTPSQMPSNIPTATHTPTYTPISTQTASPTPSMTPTFTSTLTWTPSNTPTATHTPTQTPSATPGLTPTPTRAPSHTPTSSIDDIYVFVPIADVTIRQDEPDRNYGFITTLQTDNSPIKNFLLKFDITGVGNRQILKATLRLYDEDPSSMGGDFHSTSVLSWDEGNITWNNAPESDSFLLASLGTVDANNWYEVDLTSLITTDGVYSLRVVSTSTNGADFASRESTNPPQLVLIVSNDATPASTITPSYTFTSDPTPTTTNTPTSTATPTDTLAPTNTPTFTSTSIPAVTPTDTLTVIPTIASTHIPTSTPTVIPTNTLTPTFAPTYTSTSIPPATPTSTPTLIPIATPTDTLTPTITPTFTLTSIPTATPTSTLTPTIAPTSSKPPSTATATTPAPDLVLTFTPVVDSYVNSSRSGTNYGSSSALRADGSPPVNSYVRFTVQGLGGGSISQAQLLIHANSSSSSGLTSSIVADNTWEENTITYANAPAMGNILGSSPAFSGGTWIAFDVTSYVTREGTFSFGISTPGVRAINLSSRESGTNAPQLIITTNAPTSTATATSTAISTPFYTPTATPIVMPISSPTSQSSGSDLTIVAAGDIICDSLTTSSTACQQMAASQVAVDQLPTAALILGDLCHTPSVDCFDNYFNPSWGRLFSISHPTTGNHDYLVADAVYYFDYWNGIGNMDGPAGNRNQGYYSFDIGTWHIIALNSQCSEAGGCNSGSPQYTWLQQDLQTHANLCTLAYYHIPVFSSGGRANNNMKQIYTLLYNHNVEVILNGHDHIYERFAPQDPNGLADPSRGIREFIVGTGGANHTSIATAQPNSEVRNTDTFGALKLTLHSDSYDWQFMPVAGKTFSDSGTTLCH